MILKIAFLYFAYISCGCLALLPLVSLKEIGQGFYRFFGYLCVSLDTLAVGIALYEGTAFNGNFRFSAWALGASLFFTLCFSVALRARFRPMVWTAYGLGILTNAVAIAYYPWQGGEGNLILGLNALSSALVLGAGILAMMLGHWYLVTPKLSITPLKRYSAAYILLTVFTALKLVFELPSFRGVGFPACHPSRKPTHGGRPGFCPLSGDLGGSSSPGRGLFHLGNG